MARIVHGYDVDMVADSIKADILRLIRDGDCEPEDLTDFSDVHDYCDANVLGDSEAVLEAVGIEKAVDVLNAAQEVVNEWLSVDGHHDVCPECARSHGPNYKEPCDH